MDDGSNDGTAEIIHSFKDSRINYFYQDHGGFFHLSSTFNKALTLCTGDLVAMLDSDDYWPAYKLAVQVPTLDDPDMVLSYGESTIVNPQGKKIGKMGIPEDPSIAFNDPVGSALKILLLPYCFLATSTIMVNNHMGGFVEAEGLFQAYPTWTRLSVAGRFAALPICMGFWRRHSRSILLNFDPAQGFTSAIRFMRTFAAEHEDQLKALGMPHHIEELEDLWEDYGKKITSTIITSPITNH